MRSACLTVKLLAITSRGVGEIGYSVPRLVAIFRSNCANMAPLSADRKPQKQDIEFQTKIAIQCGIVRTSEFYTKDWEIARIMEL